MASCNLPIKQPVTAIVGLQDNIHMVAPQLTTDELVGALDSLDVHFLTGGESSRSARNITPADLLAQLAAQPDARIRLAIIALLLRRPEFALALPSAVEQVKGETQQLLKLYYTAGVLLQRLYHHSLEHLLGAQPLLPNLFGSDLGVSLVSEPHEDLQRLGEQHALLTGLNINWAGTYEYAAQRLIKRLEHEVLWTHPQAV